MKFNFLKSFVRALMFLVTIMPTAKADFITEKPLSTLGLVGWLGHCCYELRLGHTKACAIHKEKKSATKKPILFSRETMQNLHWKRLITTLSVCCALATIESLNAASTENNDPGKSKENTAKKSPSNTTSEAHETTPESTPQKATDQQPESKSTATIKVTQQGENYYIAPQQALTLDQLMQPAHYAILDQIFLHIAEIAQTTPQFCLTVRTQNGNTVWTLAPKSQIKDPAAVHSATCPFCTMISDHSKGRIVAENNGALGFLSRSQYKYPRCLIIPKKPIVSMSSVIADDLDALHEMAALVAGLIKAHPTYKNFELEMHCGAAGYQTVFHLHWHFKVPHINTAADSAFLLLS
jgi:diadenosine tetraphosphate (Ap4A) HIT family hydrolase